MMKAYLVNDPSQTYANFWSLSRLNEVDLEGSLTSKRYEIKLVSETGARASLPPSDASKIKDAVARAVSHPIFRGKGADVFISPVGEGAA